MLAVSVVSLLRFHSFHYHCYHGRVGRGGRGVVRHVGASPEAQGHRAGDPWLLVGL